MSDKPNCYQCIHRREIPGDAHSQCAHPEVGELDMFASMVKMMRGGFQEATNKLNIQGDPIGIRGGWFHWPSNFDPTWLKSCSGFVAKKPKP